MTLLPQPLTGIASAGPPTPPDSRVRARERVLISSRSVEPGIEDKGCLDVHC